MSTLYPYVAIAVKEDRLDGLDWVKNWRVGCKCGVYFIYIYIYMYLQGIKRVSCVVLCCVVLCRVYG